MSKLNIFFVFFLFPPFPRKFNMKISSTFITDRDPSFSSRSGKAISENEIESSLPADSEQRSGKLYDMAIDSFNNFLASHSLQIRFPSETSQEISRAIEGKKSSFSAESHKSKTTRRN